jgi:hypothetical protein
LQMSDGGHLGNPWRMILSSLHGPCTAFLTLELAGVNLRRRYRGEEAIRCAGEAVVSGERLS